MKAMISRFRKPLALAPVAVAAMLLGAPVSAAGGPFDGLEGSWSGTGTVTYASGTKERLRCRVQYVLPNPDNLQQALRCASDSYKFQINAYFKHNSGTLSGRWDELINQVSGTLTGTAVVGVIDGSLKGPGFLASVKVETRGGKQTVVIAAQDQDIRTVSIEVRKGGN